MHPSAAERPQPNEVLSSLSTESGRHIRFAERMSITLLSKPLSPSVAGALKAIAGIQADSQPHFAREHYGALHSAFATLSASERCIVAAFTDRCLRLLKDPKLPEHAHLNYLWGMLAAQTEDSLASLFLAINGDEFALRSKVLYQAALALACHKRPEAHALVRITVNNLIRETVSPEKRGIIESGLVTGAMLRIALVISEMGMTGKSPENDLNPTKRFHHLKLLQSMINQETSRSLRERAVEAVGNITDPCYLWQHPLIAPVLPQYTPLHIPSCLMELLREAVDLQDLRAQRAAVRAIQRSYRGGEGPEATFVKDVIAGKIGGLPARCEAESFLEHLPKSHVRELYRTARAKAWASRS